MINKYGCVNSILNSYLNNHDLLIGYKTPLYITPEVISLY